MLNVECRLLLSLAVKKATNLIFITDEPAILVGSGYVKDYDRDTVYKVGRGYKHKRKVQCHFQMNSHFKQYCDIEYTTEKLELWI